MTDSTKATRATVTIGNLAIEGFMLPDGRYQMSQTQVAEAIGKPEINARRFLDSKGIKGLLGKAYTPDTIEVDSSDSARGQTRINAIPIEVATAYWFNQASKGDNQALILVWSLLTESLERRFDAAFGVSRTEQERDDRLSSRIQQLEQDLTVLGDAFEVDNAQSIELQAYREESQRLRSLLTENGISEV
jgi:hypothetical protein